MIPHLSRSHFIRSHLRHHGNHFEKHALAFEEGGGLDEAFVPGADDLDELGQRRRRVVDRDGAAGRGSANSNSGVDKEKIDTEDHLEENV